MAVIGAGPVTEAFRAQAGGEVDLVGTVLAVSRIPYGRPAELSARGVIAAWRGTCSTKHILLAALFEETWPEVPVSLWHRVYKVSATWAAAHWGSEVASTVPAAGLVDIHTYARADLGSGALVIDVTFPIDRWDGTSETVLACGPGTDHLAGPEPLKKKAALVARHCDPEVREPFIAALTSMCR